MAYSEAGGAIDTAGNVTAGGYVTKKYLFDTYPQLSDQAKSAGLWLWGGAYYPRGMMGDGAASNRSSPVQTIAGGATWKCVAGGSYHTAAIKTNGTLWTWGYNNRGQLGDNTTTQRNSPIQTIAGGTTWKALGAGVEHTAAIKTDGTLWSWGRNFEGMLGNGTGNNTIPSPVQIIAAGSTWKLLSCGGYHTAAINTDGTLWTWGRNSSGQLGDNTTTDKSSPVQTVAGGTNWKIISCGQSHAAAIKTDGTLWLWGAGNSGQLGFGGTGYKSSPIQTISAGTDWKFVSAGNYHTAAIKTNGTLWAWGDNTSGALGDNFVGGTYVLSPVQTISGGTNWKSVVAGAAHTAALKTDGTLWLWGYNYYGQLGIGTNGTGSQKSSPVQTLAGGNNWKTLAVSMRRSTMAIKDFNEDF